MINLKTDYARLQQFKRYGTQSSPNAEDSVSKNYREETKNATSMYD